MSEYLIIPIELIEKRILFIRGQKVILDMDLAALYNVKTKVLNQAVKRNFFRFPRDFMFQLTKNEKEKVVTICDHLNKLKFSANRPYAFSEHGVAMLSSVLNSEKAVQVNIQIIRTFIRLKELILSNAELKFLIGKLEKQVYKHGIQINENKDRIYALANLIKQILEIKRDKSKKKIGFIID